MSKGLPKHTGDPNIKVGEWEDIPDGTYNVNGIEEFLPNCRDAAGNPVFTEMNGLPKIAVKLRLPNGEEGPAYSCTAPEYIALVQAFGGSFTKLTRANRTSSAMLLAGKQSANATGKILRVEVKKGWTNYVPGADLPEGRYTVRFEDAHRPDWMPNYNFAEGRGGGRFLIFRFVVVGDGSGKPTIWEDYPLDVFMHDEFVESMEDSNGRMVVAKEAGIPLYRRTENGGIPINATRWDNFIRYFAPGVAEHEWEVDPLQSAYGVCEVHEPQYVFVDYAKRGGQRVVVYYKDKQRGKGRYFDMTDLPMLNGDAFDEDPEPEAEDMPLKEDASLDDLLSYISEKWAEIDIFNINDGAVVFTEEGKAWAREYMGGESGPWMRAGLDLNDRRGLHTLSPNEIGKLYAEFIAQYGEATSNPGW